jgi:cytochrome P450
MLLSPAAAGTLLEAALVAAVPWPLVRATWRRQRRGHGLPARPFLLMLAAALAWSAAAVALTAAPVALHVMALATLAGLAAWWWRQRADYGRARGLPPGSLRPLEARLWRDPEAVSDRARRHGPIFKLQPTLKPFVCVADFDLARDLLRDHGDSLAAQPWPATGEVPGGFLRFLRGDAHRRLRRIVVAAMRSDLVGPNAPALRAIARCGLARLSAAEARSQRVALRDTTEAWLALILFGVGAADPLLQRLRDLLPAAEDADRTPRIKTCRPGATSSGIALLRTLPAEPGRPDCVLARIPANARDDAVLGNLFMMLQVGAFDLASLLRWLLHYLAPRPELLARLRAAKPVERTALARACVQETLRLDQAEAVLRSATADIAFSGWTIPKGWGVRICLREPHRDPRHFADPDGFEPDRFLRDPPTGSAYAPFGVGAHACVAGEPVLALAGLMLEELAAGSELAVARDGPRMMGAYHWEPAHDFAVRLTPIAR